MAHLLYGEADGIPSQNFRDVDVEILGSAAYQAVGGSVDGLGDLDGDGYDEFFITSSDSLGDNGTLTHIFQGQATPYATLTIDDADLAIGGPSIEPKPDGFYGSFGTVVRAGGDINGDGYQDILFGQAPGFYNTFTGRVAVQYGSATGFEGGLIDNPDTLILGEGEEARNNTGFAIDGAGDVDNDGFDDVLIGANYERAGGTNAGAAYLVYGESAGIPNMNLRDAEFKFAGERGGQFGFSVSAAGDIDGDSYADVMVGSKYGEFVAIFEGGAL